MKKKKLLGILIISLVLVFSLSSVAFAAVNNQFTYQYSNTNFRRGTTPTSLRPYVKNYQTDMNNCGRIGSNLGVDGIFGSDSEKATIKFQKNRGLNPDGIAGTLTKKTLYESYLYGW